MKPVTYQKSRKRAGRFAAVFAALLFVMPLPALFAQTEELPPAKISVPASIYPYRPPSARAVSYGGFHAAFADDFSVLFSNPALLADIEPQFSIGELSTEIIDFDILNLLLGTTGEIKDVFQKISTGIEISLDIGGPLAAGFVKPNWAFGAFNVNRMHVRWDRDIIWYAQLRLSEELLLTGAYGVRMFDTGTVNGDIGITLKGFCRWTYMPRMYIDKIKYFFENINSDFFESQIGAGFDLGTRFTFYDSLSLALVFYDPFSPVYVAEYRNIGKYYKQEMIVGGLVPLERRLAFGVCWKIKSQLLRGTISDFAVMADIKDIAQVIDPKGRNRLLNLSAGIEIRLLEVLSLRAGIDEMLPSAGIGFDFTIFKLDAAVYQKEVGIDTSDYSSYAATIGILFRY